MKQGIGKTGLLLVTAASVALGAAAGRMLYQPTDAALVRLLHQQDDITDAMLRAGLQERIESTVGLLDGIASHMGRVSGEGEDLLLDLGSAAQPWIDRVCVVRATGEPTCVARNFAGPFAPSSPPGWRKPRSDLAHGPEVLSIPTERGAALLFRVPLSNSPGEVAAAGTLRNLVDAVLTNTRVPATGQVEVYDAEGTLLYHPNASYLGRTWEEIEATERPSQAWTEADEAAEERARALFIGGDSGTTRYMDQNAGGREMLSHFGPFPKAADLYLVYNRVVAAEWAAVRGYALVATTAGGMGGLVLSALLALWLAARSRSLQQAHALRLAGDKERSQQELVQLTDSLSAWIFSIDADGKIRRANREFRRFVGEQVGGDPIGRRCQEVMPTGFCGSCPGFRALWSGGTSTREISHGERKYLVRHAPVSFQDGAEREVLHLVEDVTDLRNLRGALVESEKRSSAAVLAGSIAHEINNYLTGVYGYAHLLLKNPEDTALARRTAGVVLRQLDRVKVLVGNLQRLSKPAQPQRAATDLTSLFRDLAERLATAGVTKYFEVETCWQELPPVTCDAGMIEQALTNVIINAAHAMGDVGVLRLSTRTASGELALQVEDTGPGIPEEERERLFEPFFTTKGPQGTGLGLYVTRQIVEAHGGRVEVDSRPGHGSRFLLVLPMDGSALA